MYYSADQIFNRERDRQEREDRRDDDIINRANDKLASLPDFYKSSDGIKRYTNMDDQIGNLDQSDLIAIARLIRDNQLEQVGQVLKDAILKQLLKEAEDEIDDE